MDDRLVLENYLLNLKSSVEVFVHGTLESSNIDSRDTLKRGLDTIMCSQALIYDEMTKYGWYPVCNVEKNIIKQSLNKVKKLK